MNAPALDLLLTRRTVTSAFLQAPGPSPDELETLVTAAIRVPDHGKLTPWRFIALDGDARAKLWPKLEAMRRAAMPEITVDILAKEEKAFSSAPLCLVVVSTASEHPKIPLWEQELSAGASVMNLMIAAHALGYSAQWLTGWATYDEAAKALFGVAPSEKIAGFVHVGTPSIAPTERPRPPVSQLLSHWSDGGGA